MGDPSSLIRATVGILISTLMQEGELQQWPELFDILLNKLDSENYYECEGAFSILHKIIEDNAEALDNENFCRQLNLLIPKFFQFFTNPNSKIRSYALACVNNFILNRTQIMMPYVDIFIEVMITILGFFFQIIINCIFALYSFRVYSNLLPIMIVKYDKMFVNHSLH